MASESQQAVGLGGAGDSEKTKPGDNRPEAQSETKSEAKLKEHDIEDAQIDKDDDDAGDDDEEIQFDDDDELDEENFTIDDEGERPHVKSVVTRPALRVGDAVNLISSGRVRSGPFLIAKVAGPGAYTLCDRKGAPIEKGRTVSLREIEAVPSRR